MSYLSLSYTNLKQLVVVGMWWWWNCGGPAMSMVELVNKPKSVTTQGFMSSKCESVLCFPGGGG
jgi:hypothetical protein